MKRILLIVLSAVFLTASAIVIAWRAPLQPIPAAPNYRLAFVNFGPLNMDIFIADADGNNPKPLLPHPAHDYNASFSADGRVVSADGSVVKVLTDNQFEEGAPAWMPLK